MVWCMRNIITVGLQGRKLQGLRQEGRSEGGGVQRELVEETVMCPCSCNSKRLRVQLLGRLASAALNQINVYRKCLGIRCVGSYMSTRESTCLDAHGTSSPNPLHPWLGGGWPRGGISAQSGSSGERRGVRNVTTPSCVLISSRNHFVCAFECLVIMFSSPHIIMAVCVPKLLRIEQMASLPSFP